MGILRGVDTVLRTAIAVPLLAVGLGALCLCAIGTALLGQDQRKIHRWYRYFGRWFMFIGGTELRVHGADQIDPDQAYVIVANHESNWDPPALIAGLQQLIIRFVVKRQLIGIPIFGRTLSLTGNVTVDRSRSRGDVDRLRSSMQGRDSLVSILFFAEGTRSRDGRLTDFKKGAFATALAAGIPILPVAIAGTRYVWTPGSLRVRRAPVIIEVGEPILASEQDFEQRDALRRQTQEVVAKLRASAYASLVSEGYPKPPDL